MFGLVDQRMRRDVGWNLVPVVLLAVVGLSLNFTIAGHWGARPLGAFNIVSTAWLAFAVLGAAGLQFAVLRAVAEAPDDEDRVAAVVVGALVPNVVLSAVATAAFVLLRGPIGALVHSTLVPEGILWAAPGLAAFSVNKTLLGVVNGLRRMRAFAVYTSLRYLLIGAGLAYARAADLPAAQLPLIWSITEVALFAVLVAELLATVSLRRARGWRAWTRTHLDYGARSVLSTLAWEVNSKLDIWVVASVMPETSVGIYSLASVVYEGALQLPVVLANNVNPLIARHVAAGELADVHALIARSRRWFVPSMVVACALGAAVYPSLIPALVGDPAFRAGAVPFAILMGGIAVTSPWLPFNQTLLMADRPGWHTAYIVAMVAIAATALVLLVPAFGLAGAGAGTALGLVASAVLLRAVVRARVGLRL